MDAPTSAHAPQLPSGDAAQLMAMINGAWVTQVIRAACVLGLPDHLSQQSADACTLAAASGCKVAALQRLLFAMAALELALCARLQPNGPCSKPAATRPADRRG